MEFTELQMQTPTLGFQKSNAVTGSLRSSYVRGTSIDSPRIGVRLTAVSAGTGALDSDFIFARHEARASYNYTRHPHSIEVNFHAGKITGKAPMHERFSIGNAQTLRGWNKYEIDPLGGNRVVYGSGGVQVQGDHRLLRCGFCLGLRAVSCHAAVRRCRSSASVVAGTHLITSAPGVFLRYSGVSHQRRQCTTRLHSGNGILNTVGSCLPDGSPDARESSVDSWRSP